MDRSRRSFVVQRRSGSGDTLKVGTPSFVKTERTWIGWTEDHAITDPDDTKP